MFLSGVFIASAKRPHSYIVVNSHQMTDDRLRVISNLFEEETPSVYIPKLLTAKY